MERSFSENIANLLSTLTIVSCLFLKVPQIMYMREKRSAEGIYVQAMIMEVIGFSIMTLYNYTNQYNIMTYMEYPIILVQVFVMFFHVLKYKNLLCLPIVPLTTAGYWIIVFGFLIGTFPKYALSYMVPFCTPLSGFAKVTYIYGIIKEENADAVSLTTWVISVSTNLARIYTVYVDSTDVKLLTNFCISTFLSSAVLGTALYYKKMVRYRCESPEPEPKRYRRRKCSDSDSHSD